MSDSEPEKYSLFGVGRPFQPIRRFDKEVEEIMNVAEVEATLDPSM
jgi:hypothetical protein